MILIILILIQKLLLNHYFIILNYLEIYEKLLNIFIYNILKDYNIKLVNNYLFLFFIFKFLFFFVF